jgi:hypothetical protein
MSSAQAEQLFGEEHVRRYRETDGEVGHIWKEGSTILLRPRPAAAPARRRRPLSSTTSTAIPR